ncbi:MAG: HlyD family efflux transporter periplasmic adaptor subunit [Xenococcaceae cyanobacterium]
MDTTVILIKPVEELFTEAELKWNLSAIYAKIETTKNKLFGEKQITSLQKTILRGLLCKYTPQQIAARLPEDLEEVEQLVNNLSWKLYRCVKAATGIETNNLESYKNIPDLLKTAGYQTKITSQFGDKQLLPKVDIDRRDRLPSYRNTAIVSQQNAILHITSDSQLIPTPLQETTDLLPPDRQPGRLNIIPQEEALALVDADDFLPSINRWTKLGGMFLVTSVGMAIALAAFTPYHVTVKAQAKIRPAAGLKIVEAETGGTIVAIRVEENQIVKQGDVIAVVDRSRLETQKSQLESNIQQANLQLKQIEAQIASQDRRISAEKDRINRAIASAKSQLTLRYREYQDRKITTNAQVNEAVANLRLSEQELYQAQTELTSAQASLKSAEAALNSAISKRDRYQTIADSGAISQNQLEETKLEVEQRKQDVVSRQAVIDRQHREISRRKQAIAAARARLSNVRASLNPSDAEIAIAKQNIAQEQAIGQATLATLKREKEALIQQAIEIANQLKRYRSELAQLEKDLQQTTIKASADGIVFQLKLKNPGQIVLPGEEIAHIAPDSTSLSIQALVPAQQIANVAVAQPVQAKISACPYPDYGTLKGVVSKIAPDASIASGGNPTASKNPSKAVSGNFYEVKITPESLALKKRNKQCNLQLGMEGIADIITKEETVLKFMLRKARLLTDM